MADAVVYTNHVVPNASGVYTNATEEPESSSEWQGLGKILWIYLAPIIFIVGVTGNVLILVIMSNRKFRGTSTCIYLCCMALADMLVLIIGMIPEWVSATFDKTFKELNPVTCGIDKFLSYTVGDIAIWILVAFTVDRFIAVCYPLEKTEICTSRRAKLYCLGLALVACTKNFHVFWTRGPDPEENEQCGKPEPYKYFEKVIRPWIAFTLISALPFIIIIVCNSFIVRTLVRTSKLHKNQQIQSSSDRAYTQMTLMCLSASLAFLLLITPSIILLIGKPKWKGNDGYNIAKAINNQLVYVNHSINFFLYCMSGKRFRDELLRVLRCREKSGNIHSTWENSDNQRGAIYTRVNRTSPGNTPRGTPRGTPKLTERKYSHKLSVPDVTQTTSVV